MLKRCQKYERTQPPTLRATPWALDETTVPGDVAVAGALMFAVVVLLWVSV